VVGDDGAVRRSGSALRRTLLALLVLYPGQVLAPDWLMEHMWGEGPPDSGLRALRFHISRLRKEIGAGVPIETRPGGYVLGVARDSVVWSSLILAQYRAGQQAEALRSCERLRATLAESLGLAPSPERDLADARSLRQRRVLRDEGDVRQYRGAARRAAEHRHVSLGGVDQTRDEVQQRRLPAPFGPTSPTTACSGTSRSKCFSAQRRP
jgi:DNA-binding SARP family transcriptional activator